MSLRPSFSLSSTSPWMIRRPRLTWVSEGNDFRRLRVMLKAGKVFEIMKLAHDMPHRLIERLDCRGALLSDAAEPVKPT
jgi:hypothetical protein